MGVYVLLTLEALSAALASVLGLFVMPVQMFSAPRLVMSIQGMGNGGYT